MTKKRSPQSYIYTHSGLALYPDDITPGDIYIDDISFGLAGIYRYNGQTRISVLRHSIAVGSIAYALSSNDPRAGLLGLLHDAAEVYMLDIPVPLKRFVKPMWFKVYGRIEAAIYEQLGCKSTKKHKKLVRSIDQKVVSYEMNFGSQKASRSFMRHPEVINPLRETQVVSSFYRWDLTDTQLQHIFYCLYSQWAWTRKAKLDDNQEKVLDYLIPTLSAGHTPQP